MDSIRILGAGPSGMTAAIRLAMRGQSVDVYERMADAGGRFHGDIQGLENYSDAIDTLEELRSLGIDIAFDAEPVSTPTFSDGRTLSKLDLPRPLFYLVRRGPTERTVDTSLRVQAQRLGVRFHFEATRSPEDVDIVATGPQPRTVFVVSKGIVFDTGMPDQVLVLAHEAAAVRGYAYLVVSRGYGCICNVLFDEFARANTCLEEAKRLFGELTPLDIRNPRPVGGFGGISNQNEFRVGDRLYVGEAAGIQDALCAYGLRSALQSGALAAEAILEGKDYAELAEAKFREKIAAGLVLRFLWNKIGATGYGMIFRHAHRLRNPFPLLRASHHFHPLQRLIYPIAKWSLQREYPKLAL